MKTAPNYTKMKYRKTKVNKIYNRCCKRCGEMFESFSRHTMFCQSCTKRPPSPKLYPYIDYDSHNSCKEVKGTK